MTLRPVQRVDFVTTRYWLRGGAEAAIRKTAEHLAAATDWDIHLHATTAVSTGTWENVLTPGTSSRDGVTVHLHPVEGGRSPSWGGLNERVKASPTTVGSAAEELFFRAQGPVSPQLATAVATSPADFVVFTPYLFWTTTNVFESVAHKALIHPAAHDEPYLRLSLVRDVLTRCQGLLYASDAERRLVESLSLIHI